MKFSLRRLAVIVTFIILASFLFFVFLSREAGHKKTNEKMSEIVLNKGDVPLFKGGTAPLSSGSLWENIKDAFSGRQGHQMPSDFIVEEDQATKAETVLKRLLTLDPEKDSQEINLILNKIREIGYPASRPIGEFLKLYRSEKQILLLLRALGQIADADLSGELKTLISSHASKTVREEAYARYKERAPAPERENFIKETISDLKAGSSKDYQEKPESKTNRLYKIEMLAAFGGEEAFSALKDIAENSNEDIGIRHHAIEAMGGLHTNEAFDFLLNLVKEGSDLKEIAVAALSKNASKLDLDSVITMYKNVEDVSLKSSLINIAGAKGGADASSFLIDILKNSAEEPLITVVGNAFGNFSDRKTIQTLADIMRTSPERIRQAAASNALSHIGDAATPFLEGLIIKQSGPARLEAIRALGNLKTQKSYAILKRTLEDWRVADEPESQRHLLNAFRQHERKEIVPQIEQIAFRASDESVRREAMETAADLKKVDELKFIMDVYRKDESESVKRGAIRLMRKFGDADTANMLRLELLYNTQPQLKEEIEQALNEIEGRIN